MLLPRGLFPHGLHATVLQTGPHRALEPLCRLPTALFLLQWVQPWDCESAKQGQGTSETWERFLKVARPAGSGAVPPPDTGLCVLQAGAEISTVNPEQYSKRFNEFMSNILT